MASANVVHGEAPPIRIIGAHLPTGRFDDIIKEADMINLEVKSADTNDHKENDKLLQQIQDAHKDFAASFPLVLRWTVQTRQFDPKAFRKFLKYYQKQAAGPGATAVFPTREKFLEVQAEYLIYLYKAVHPHYDADSIRNYRQAIMKQLLDEDAEFLKVHEDVSADIEKRKREADKLRRSAIYEFILRQRGKPAGPAPKASV